MKKAVTCGKYLYTPIVTDLNIATRLIVESNKIANI
jgi:hypothetical protein